MKYDLIQYNTKPRLKQIDCICDNCNHSIFRRRGDITKAIKLGRVRYFCKECVLLKIKGTIICKECSSPFIRSGMKHIFCGQSCSAKYNNRLRPVFPKKDILCPFCKKLFNRRGKQQCCSIKCSKLLLRQTRNNQILNGTFKYSSIISEAVIKRRFLIQQNGEQCSKCGWNKKNPSTQKSPLELHHIDGNCANNTFDNLVILCPNCHSLTSNHKNSNSVYGDKGSPRYHEWVKYFQKQAQNATMAESKALLS